MISVDYVDHMGSDLSVVNAARVSYNNESKLNYRGEVEDRDKRLIRFLARNDHISPFFHATVKVRVKAPVPIRTHCFKHKQGFAENEESRRYIKTEPELYIPDYFRKAPENSKQGSGGRHPFSNTLRLDYEKRCKEAINTYLEYIALEVAPEQARFVLPQGVMVNWIWTGSLAAFARFYGLRSASDAQKEVGIVAEQVREIVEPLFPISWKYLTEN